MSKVIWITGVSGVGKSTFAKAIFNKIKTHYNKPAILLDGDELREVLSFNEQNNDFTREKRLSASYKYAKLCKIIANQNITVVIATISLFKEIHSWNRLNLPGYYEIFMKAPLDELKKRDPKGIYKNFFLGNIKNVSGLDLPIDEPQNPDWVINFNPSCSMDDLVETFLKKIQ